MERHGERHRERELPGAGAFQDHRRHRRHREVAGQTPRLGADASATRARARRLQAVRPCPCRRRCRRAAANRACARRTCSQISPTPRCRSKPACPVAQNVQPVRHTRLGRDAATIGTVSGSASARSRPGRRRRRSQSHFTVMPSVAPLNGDRREHEGQIGLEVVAQCVPDVGERLRRTALGTQAVEHLVGRRSRGWPRASSTAPTWRGRRSDAREPQAGSTSRSVRRGRSGDRGEPDVVVQLPHTCCRTQ